MVMKDMLAGLVRLSVFSKAPKADHFFLLASQAVHVGQPQPPELTSVSSAERGTSDKEAQLQYYTGISILTTQFKDCTLSKCISKDFDVVIEAPTKKLASQQGSELTWDKNNGKHIDWINIEAITLATVPE